MAMSKIVKPDMRRPNFPKDFGKARADYTLVKLFIFIKCGGRIRIYGGGNP
jgi:hypothetical protein